MNSLGRVFLAMLSIGFTAAAQQTPELHVEWDRVLLVSKTSATLQVVVNPMLRRGSPIHDQAFAALRELGADYVRYVPWLPYPRLAVAELEPNVWDFSLIDPMTLDFLHATEGHSVMLNFSTIPAWLFRTDAPVRYPADPDHVVWNYTQGTELREGGLKKLGDYHARLVSWYTKGGFADEQGNQHTSGHHFDIPYWEVFNEVDIEHRMTPEQYTERYDAVVSSIRAVAPEMKFVGLSLAFPGAQPEMFEYFLNHANHQPGIPLDMISYHFYANPTKEQTADHWQYTFFDKADGFLTTVRYIEAIRKRLSPETKTTLNELGNILPGDWHPDTPNEPERPIPDIYWNASGAMFAYIYVETAKLGIDVVGESQLVGFPTQFPSVTMIDWETGRPNARYWVLKLILDNFRPGDKLISTRLANQDVVAQAFATSRGRQLLLINKRNREAPVHLAEAVAEGSIAVVDSASGQAAARVAPFSGKSLVLKPFAVAVLSWR
jgi:hypothetical protein